MMQRILLFGVITFLLNSCDDDFRQGSCEDGFYQQNDGNGGFFCAPIFEDGLDEPTDSEINNLGGKD